MADYVALLRGINVGQAKRVPMAVLRETYGKLGLRDVATLLNSGNAVFAADAEPDPAALRAAVLEATGVDSETIVVSAERFREIAAANPLGADDRTPTRVIVAFAATPLSPEEVEVPAVLDDEPEEMVVTPGAIYQWIPDGVLSTKVPLSFWRTLGTTVTARNQQTVAKIVAVLDKRAG
ncbi:DUF1697 domain-containing protein [Frondihabitans australicus]|uniref:Uncharacterized protein (DUF1697 family) n=1 Tax=Frondihabitans australicus TaxID=386892 RepID=A0A495IHB8_9MICO|nr:DUF1697 domain-containing protein [Frondihabitans australicus]RKR74545.1 uncharacterized protein (DUF1697 family) [Frondihabitans australicus]